ncbi:MAG: hypothetical protein WDM78_09380 [Puia sp.]
MYYDLIRPVPLLSNPATATVDGQKLRTNPIQISVHNQTGQGNAKTPGFGPLPDPSWRPHNLP